MEISVQQKGEIVVLNISGNVDIDSSFLIEKVSWCLKVGLKEIICNFEEVMLVDYVGLSALAIAYRNILNNKGRMKLTNVPAHVQRFFALVYMDNLFDVYPGVDEALASFKSDKLMTKIQKKPFRRRFRRLNLKRKVEFKSKSESWDDKNSGDILNISGIGVLIFCRKLFPLGEILDLRFGLSSGLSDLDVEGRVAWHVSKDLQHHIYPGMGVEFYKIGTETQERIIEFVENNLSMDGEEDRENKK